MRGRAEKGGSMRTPGPGAAAPGIPLSEASPPACTLSSMIHMPSVLLMTSCVCVLSSIRRKPGLPGPTACEQ